MEMWKEGILDILSPPRLSTHLETPIYKTHPFFAPLLSQDSYSAVGTGRGGGRNLRVPPCFVPCRAVPCQVFLPNKILCRGTHDMYQWFRFALFRDFLCVVSRCCTMCFPTHS